MLAAALLPSLLVGCAEKQSAPVATAPPPKVQLGEVSQADVPIIMTFPGTVQAYRDVAVVPRVSGFIVQRHFDEGAFVKKNDLLYVIDPRPFQTQVAAAQAQLESDRANVKFWQQEAERYANLVAKGAGSVENKEKADSSLAEFQASVAADEAALENAKLDLGYTEIRAPFDGRVGDTRFYEGALVTEQQSVLTSVVTFDPIHVVFHMSRARLAEVQKLQADGLAPKTLEAFTAQLTLPDGLTFEQRGTLDFMSNSVESSTDSIGLRALFNNPAQTEPGLVLIPGQYVALHLTAGTRPGSLLIPQKALLRSQGGDTVLVVGKDDKAESRSVKVIDTYKDKFVVESGVHAGERVVVEGLQAARPGQPVDPVAAQENKESASAAKAG